MRWWLLIILAIFFIHLQYQLWQGKDGRADSEKLQLLIQRQQQENTRLQQRNDSLIAEIIDLKNGHEALEERARVDFGMIQPGEKFYQFVK
jgi:cell division protein FtsB